MSQQQKQLKILLLGDSCYDEYHYGTVTRISPEAPIPIFDKTRSYTRDGMASNVYDNFINLGANVHIITQFMEKKHRYIDVRSGQQVLRVDEPCKREVSFDNADDIFDLDLNTYDVIVISDYDKGFISYETIEHIIHEYAGPIFIDTKKQDLARFQGSIIKINELEYSKITSTCDNLVVTYGSEKVVWNNKNYFPPKVEAHDVCGAGDTFLAALVFDYLKYNNMEQAIMFAMKAAAITVQKNGVYAPTLEEIEQ